MGTLTSLSAREINRARRTPGAPVWQRGYCDPIIRNEDELQAIREYIANNPLRRAIEGAKPRPPAGGL